MIPLVSFANNAVGDAMPAREQNCYRENVRFEFWRRPPTPIKPSASRNGFKLAILPLLTDSFFSSFFDFVGVLRALNIFQYSYFGLIDFPWTYGASERISQSNMPTICDNSKQLRIVRTPVNISESLGAAIKQTFFLSSDTSSTCTNSPGHSSSSLISQSGPVNHIGFHKNACGNCPLEIALAGLVSDLTCRHSFGSINVRISAIRFDMKLLSRWGSVRIQCSTMVALKYYSTEIVF